MATAFSDREKFFRHYDVRYLWGNNAVYIDICYEIGIENYIPWWDDLFLDIVALPTGEVIQQDEDELEEALESGSIYHKMYDLA